MLNASSCSSCSSSVPSPLTLLRILVFCSSVSWMLRLCAVLDVLLDALLAAEQACSHQCVRLVMASSRSLIALLRAQLLLQLQRGRLPHQRDLLVRELALELLLLLQLRLIQLRQPQRVQRALVQKHVALHLEVGQRGVGRLLVQP